MDDQQQDKPEVTGDVSPEAAAATPAPDDGGVVDPVPDAVKAAGADPIGEASVPADADPLSPDAIVDPTMDLPELDVAAPSSPTHVVERPDAHPAEFPQFGDGAGAKVNRNIDLLMDVKLPVSIELGRTTLPISEILEWGQGSIIELDRLAGEAVDLMVNNKLVAKGEVVVVDEKFGLRITSLISPRERLETL